MSELNEILRTAHQGYGPYVQITPDNGIGFKIQEGPIGVVGENGCQIDFLLYFVRDFLVFHNKRFPCRENSCAITKVDEALHWLAARTQRRITEGTEGTDQEKATN